jgi:hypothetical protein
LYVVDSKRTPLTVHGPLLVERGYRMLALGFDWSLLQRGAAAILDGVRRG